MLIRQTVDFLYLCLPIKCDTNCALSSLKVLMELGVNLLNHTLVGPINVVRKARHMILSETPCKCMNVLNDSKWSKGSLDPSSFYLWHTELWQKGELLFGGSTRRGRLTPLPWGSSSWSSSFPSSCISATICGGAISAMNGRLVSCRSYLLRALLPSGPARSPLLAMCWGLVPFCSSPWLLGLAFLWRSYSSRSWFCLVRHSTAAAKVCTCLSRAIMRGSSPWFLLVAINRVSTIQLFV